MRRNVRVFVMGLCCMMLAFGLMACKREEGSKVDTQQSEGAVTLGAGQKVTVTPEPTATPTPEPTHTPTK